MKKKYFATILLCFEHLTWFLKNMSTRSTSAALIPYIPPLDPMDFVKSIVEGGPISKISNELMVQVFSFLGLNDLLTCSLVCRKWKNLSDTESLWSFIFKTTDLKLSQFNNIGFDETWRYSNLAVRLGEYHRFGMAIAAGKHHANLMDKDAAAYAFRKLCVLACGIKAYDIALRCQQLAQKYYSYSGSKSMSAIIISKVSDQTFPLESAELVEQAMSLIEKRSKFGWEALLAIKQRFEDLQLLERAAALKPAFASESYRNFQLSTNYVYIHLKEKALTPSVQMGYMVKDHGGLLSFSEYIHVRPMQMVQTQDYMIHGSEIDDLAHTFVEQEQAYYEVD